MPLLVLVVFKKIEKKNCILVLPKFEVNIEMDKCMSRYAERFLGSVIAR